MKVYRVSMVMLLSPWLSAVAQPSITRQPADTIVSAGGTAQFIPGISSTTPPVSYRWWFQDAALDAVANPSAATRQLSLTNVSLAHVGSYFFVVTDAIGSSTSRVATLTIESSFTKIPPGPVVNSLGLWQAASWWDYDRDGFLDLYITGFPGDVMYHNNGDRTFTTVTNAISTGALSSRAAAVADFNNDGREDLLAIHSPAPEDLFRNEGNGEFARLTKAEVGPPIGDADGSMDVGWADYDRDGFLDLFAANAYVKIGNDSLYKNNADGTFRKITANEAGALLLLNTPTGPCAWADYDNDGYPDLWVGAVWDEMVGVPQNLWHNNRDGTFERVLAGSLAPKTGLGTAVWADYDNDGLLDLFVTSVSDTNSLHHNLGGSTFENVTLEAGLAQRITAYSAAWGDYDNDGYLDLFVAEHFGAQQTKQSILYHNTGNGAFTRAEVGSPLREGSNRDNVTWADYDNDGFLDLFITCGRSIWVTSQDLAGLNLLYHNSGNTNHWLKVKLAGTASNASGIGAKVRVQATIRGRTVWQLREISGNSSFSGGTPGLIAHFGLGDATNVDVVRIEWPSGIVQELHQIAAGQSLSITEHQDSPASAPVLAIVRPGNGTVQLTLTCPTNLVYVIETSTDLAQWTKAAARKNVAGAIEFTPALATNTPQRFYRALAP